MAQTTTERLAANLRAELARRKISGRQLSVALDWKPSNTSRRLSGRQPLSVDELTQVAAYLEVPLTDLLGEAVA